MVRSSRDRRAKVVFLLFITVRFTGFVFATVPTLTALFVPAELNALGAVMAFNARTKIVFDSTDHRIYVTTRNVFQTPRRSGIPIPKNQLRIERLRCSDKLNYYKNYFVVLVLPDREIPIYQHPDESVVTEKLAQIIATLA